MFKKRKPKVRQNPDPPKPCYVVNRENEKYYLAQPSHALPEDNQQDILTIIYSGNLRSRFESHARAHSAIHHTIEWLKAQNKEWSKEDFRVVDL